MKHSDSSAEKSCLKCGATLPAHSSVERCRRCRLLDSLEASDEGDDKEESTDLTSILAKPHSALEVKLHRFGDYELLEEIARGGMGVVFRAHQVSLARSVALKFLTAQRAGSTDARRRFRLEAELAGRLDHPNIVPVLDAGEYQGTPYLTMRHVRGDALVLEDLSPETLCCLLVKIARAVHHAHSRGVLHRDLKPSNILLDREGEPHVTDFGLARVLESESDLTNSAAMLGTPRYMAPEQCGGGNKEVTAASDVYALGVMLYQGLSGRLPFEGDSTLDVIRQVNEDPPPKLHLHHGERDLGIICLKCLEKEPSKRYVSALSLAEDLERFAGKEPILAKPSGTWERTCKWIRRQPALAAMAGLTILALLLGISISLWQASESKARGRELAANLYAADMLEAHRAFNEGRYRKAQDLLKEHVPKPGALDHRGWEWHWHWGMTNPQFELLFERPGVELRCADLSPDGKTLLIGCSDGTAWLVDLSDGKATLFHQNHRRIIDADFSPDGQWLLLMTRETQYTTRITEKHTIVFQLTAAVPHEYTSFHQKYRSPNRNQIREFARILSAENGRPLLVLGGDDGSGRARWHGIQVIDFQKPEGERRTGMMHALTGELLGMSHDGRQLIIADGADLRLVDVMRGKSRELPTPFDGETWSQALHAKRIDAIGATRAANISPSGKELVLFGLLEDGEACGAMVHLETNDVIHRFDLNNHAQAFPTWLGGNLVTVNEKVLLQTWRADSQSILTSHRKISGIEGKVTFLIPHPSGVLLTGSSSGQLQRWDLSAALNETFRRSAGVHSGLPRALLSQDASTIAVGSLMSNTTQVWDEEAKAIIHQFEGVALWLAPSGKEAVTLDSKEDAPTHIIAISRWDLTPCPARRVERRLISPPIKGAFHRVAWSDGSKAALGKVDGSIVLIDLRTGETEPLPVSSNQPISGLSLSPNGQYLAFVGIQCGMIDLRSGRLVRALTSAYEGNHRRSFSPGGEYFAHATMAGHIEIYDMNALNAPPRVLRAHQGTVYGLDFSPDGKTLASADRFGVVKLWNVATWREMAEFTTEGHIEFSRDGRCLVTSESSDHGTTLVIRRLSDS